MNTSNMGEREDSQREQGRARASAGGIRSSGVRVAALPKGRERALDDRPGEGATRRLPQGPHRIRQEEEARPEVGQECVPDALHGIAVSRLVHPGQEQSLRKRKATRTTTDGREIETPIDRAVGSPDRLPSAKRGHR